MRDHSGGTAAWSVLGTMIQAVAVQNTKFLPELLRSHELMIGWVDWKRQHDAAEFLGHMLSKLPVESNALLGEWGGIDLASGGYREGYSHPLRQCTPIPLAERPDQTPQQLLYEWARQTPNQALFKPTPEMVCLQLLRYLVVDGAVVKNSVPLARGSLDSHIAFPAFQIGDSVTIEYVNYSVLAIVVHYGRSPHYIALLGYGEGWWEKNDEKCSYIGALGEEHLSNVYLMFLGSSASPWRTQSRA